MISEAEAWWLRQINRYGNFMTVTQAPDVDHMGRSAAHDSVIKRGFVQRRVDEYELSSKGLDALQDYAMRRR